MNISKLNTIDHLAITVDDINQSVSWYLKITHVKSFMQMIRGLFTV